MVAKAWGSTDKTAEKKAVEEVFFQNDAVSLCLLINRRAKTMRVVDFRAGPSNAKRTTVMSLAQREGVDKVYTLVERDEVATWTKLGFAKEGNIPGFYKRSDAFLLGCTVPAANAKTKTTKNVLPSAHVSTKALRDRVSHTDARYAQAALEVDLEDVESADVPDPAVARAEKTIVQAKKLAKELQDRPLPVVKITPIREAETKKQVATALRAGRGLTAFEPFGRDVERRFFQLTARAGFELVVSTEAQSCFGNTFLELLTSPRSENDRLATISAIRTMCDRLLAESTVSCFSLAPSDDIGLATAFVFNGFRRTGILQNHVLVGGARRDAIIWSRKLANPADE
ncbi:MAG: hypothetical protein U0169_10445 [Polyangiaceae bacterium]